MSTHGQGVAKEGSYMNKCDLCKRKKCVWLNKDPKKLNDDELDRVITHNLDVIEMTFRGHQGSAHAEERMHAQLEPYVQEQDWRKGKLKKKLKVTLADPPKKPVACDTEVQYTGKPMNKNVVKTVRVNDQVLKLLKDHGYTVQQFFDEALAKKIAVQTTIKFKK